LEKVIRQFVAFYLEKAYKAYLSFVVFYLEKAYLSVCRLLHTWKNLISQFVVFYLEKAYLSLCHLPHRNGFQVNAMFSTWEKFVGNFCHLPLFNMI
jgi:hypothetical protein